MAEIKVTAGLPYKVVPIDGLTGAPVGGNPSLGGTPLYVDVQGNAGRILVQPTLTVHATYVTGDYVGQSGVCMRFANAARTPGGTGLVQSVVLIDYALQSVSGELWLFDDAVTPPADSAAWTLTDADMLKNIGVAYLNEYAASAANSVARMKDWPIGFKCAVGSKDLFGCFVTRGSPAYASGDLAFKILTLQD